MADMPFMSYTNVDQALSNATDLIQLGGAQMVKLEASTRQVSIVQELSECGIPICAHSVFGLNTFINWVATQFRVMMMKVLKSYLTSAANLQAAGADMLLLECVPNALAKKITQNCSIPVIGIGAGPRLRRPNFSVA